MRIFFFAVLIVISQPVLAQFPTISTSSDIYHSLLKAENGTSVLYIAAHPDDENTRLISYFENQKFYRTAYLSLTRGDGGQNLIGTEIGAGIGVLRTQELLGARRIDGGEQFFTRAVDFGYSKSSEETFEKWERDAVLSDIVWVIRKFRPDVIVTRFPPTDYAGHGHHKASAILAEEAFELAADPTAYPDQLKDVEIWQTKSMYFNTSSWWVKDLEKQAANSNDFVRLDVGAYNPIIGESYSQIAARARSQHRSQGFGSDYPSGTKFEYLKYVKGERIDFNASHFENRWEQNEIGKGHKQIQSAIDSFEFSQPSQSVAQLTEAAKTIGQGPESIFKSYKLKELNNLILACLAWNEGLYFSNKYLVRNAQAPARLNLTNPSDVAIEVRRATFLEQQWDINQTVVKNELFSEEYQFDIPADFPFSNPYWLNKAYTTTYVVENQKDIGKPQNDPSVFIDLELEINGYAFTTQITAQYKEVDPAKAVVYSPVYVIPSLSFNFSENVMVAAGDQEKSIYLTITNHGNSNNGSISLDIPKGWTASPKDYQLSFEKPGASQLIEFKIKSSKNAALGICKPIWTNESISETTYSLTEIKYDHIPAQIILKPSSIDFRPIELNRGSISTIGYIDGSGDDVDKYLRAAGYQVDIISPEDLLVDGALDKYDAIITGIRAYNTRSDLSYANDKLNKYVKNGGTWLVQYNTSHRLKSEEIGPYPFTISRERVTDEFAEVTVLSPNHRVMNFPNKIEDNDWENWVQERGLYFAGDWDKAFVPILSWHDAGEPARKGGLLIAEYGEGHFVYSGISFFRELPAGVPGAYRLLANILDLSTVDSNPSND